MPFELDPDILDKISLEAEQDRDVLARQALQDANELLARLNGSQSEAQHLVDSLFKADDYAPVDPFTPPDNVPVWSQEKYQQNKAIAVGQSRADEVGEIIAKNHVKVKKIESHYADAALIQAQTRVKYQNIVNEGFKLEQAIKVGELIGVKTEGIQLEIDKQNVLNSTARRLVEIESQKGAALIEGATLEVEAIRSENQSRLIESGKDFQLLKGTSPTGGY